MAAPDQCIWQGSVQRKQKKTSLWQNLGLQVYKEEFRCFKNEQFSKPIAHIDLSGYELQVESNVSHQIILSNISVKLVFKFSLESHLVQVVKGLVKAGLTVQGSDKLLKAVEDRGSLGISIKSPTQLGNKLERRFSRKLSEDQAEQIKNNVHRSDLTPGGVTPSETFDNDLKSRKKSIYNGPTDENQVGDVIKSDATTSENFPIEAKPRRIFMTLKDDLLSSETDSEDTRIIKREYYPRPSSLALQVKTTDAIKRDQSREEKKASKSPKDDDKPDPWLISRTPIEPPSNQPTPNEPPSNQLTPNEPLSNQPTPNEPSYNQPTPNEPSSNQPIPVKTLLNQPSPIEASSDQPVPIETSFDQPVPNETTCDPLTTMEPSSSKPSTAESSPSQPALIQPALIQPSPDQPATIEIKPPQIDSFGSTMDAFSSNSFDLNPRQWPEKSFAKDADPFDNTGGHFTPFDPFNEIPSTPSIPLGTSMETQTVTPSLDLFDEPDNPFNTSSYTKSAEFSESQSVEQSSGELSNVEPVVGSFNIKPSAVESSEYEPSGVEPPNVDFEQSIDDGTKRDFSIDPPRDLKDEFSEIIERNNEQSFREELPSELFESKIKSEISTDDQEPNPPFIDISLETITYTSKTFEKWFEENTHKTFDTGPLKDQKPLGTFDKFQEEKLSNDKKSKSLPRDGSTNSAEPKPRKLSLFSKKPADVTPSPETPTPRTGFMRLSSMFGKKPDKNSVIPESSMEDTTSTSSSKTETKVEKVDSGKPFKKLKSFFGGKTPDEKKPFYDVTIQPIQSPADGDRIQMDANFSWKSSFAVKQGETGIDYESQDLRTAEDPNKGSFEDNSSFIFKQTSFDSEEGSPNHSEALKLYNQDQTVNSSNKDIDISGQNTGAFGNKDSKDNQSDQESETSSSEKSSEATKEGKTENLNFQTTTNKNIQEEGLNDHHRTMMDSIQNIDENAEKSKSEIQNEKDEEFNNFESEIFFKTSNDKLEAIFDTDVDSHTLAKKVDAKFELNVEQRLKYDETDNFPQSIFDELASTGFHRNFEFDKISMKQPMNDEKNGNEDSHQISNVQNKASFEIVQANIPMQEIAEISQDFSSASKLEINLEESPMKENQTSQLTPKVKKSVNFDDKNLTKIYSASFNSDFDSELELDNSQHSDNNDTDSFKHTPTNTDVLKNPMSRIKASGNYISPTQKVVDNNSTGGLSFKGNQANEEFDKKTNDNISPNVENINNPSFSIMKPATNQNEKRLSYKQGLPSISVTCDESSGDQTDTDSEKSEKETSKRNKSFKTQLSLDIPTLPVDKNNLNSQNNYQMLFPKGNDSHSPESNNQNPSLKVFETGFISETNIPDPFNQIEKPSEKPEKSFFENNFEINSFDFGKEEPQDPKKEILFEDDFNADAFNPATPNSSFQITEDTPQTDFDETESNNYFGEKDFVDEFGSKFSKDSFFSTTNDLAFGDHEGETIFFSKDPFEAEWANVQFPTEENQHDTSSFKEIDSAELEDGNNKQNQEEYLPNNDSIDKVDDVSTQDNGSVHDQSETEEKNLFKTMKSIQNFESEEIGFEKDEIDSPNDKEESNSKPMAAYEISTDILTFKLGSYQREYLKVVPVTKHEHSKEERRNLSDDSMSDSDDHIIPGNTYQEGDMSSDGQVQIEKPKKSSFIKKSKKFFSFRGSTKDKKAESVSKEDGQKIKIKTKQRNSFTSVLSLNMKSSSKSNSLKSVNDQEHFSTTSEVNTTKKSSKSDSLKSANDQEHFSTTSEVKNTKKSFEVVKRSSSNNAVDNETVSNKSNNSEQFPIAQAASNDSSSDLSKVETILKNKLDGKGSMDKEKVISIKNRNTFNQVEDEVDFTLDAISVATVEGDNNSDSGAKSKKASFSVASVLSNKNKSKSSSLPDINQEKPKRKLGKSLRKSFKNLTSSSKASVYVVTPETEEKVSKPKKKSFKKEGNARFKIGNSSFYLPSESNTFKEDFLKMMTQPDEVFVPPVAPVRKKKKEKSSEVETEEIHHEHEKSEEKVFLQQEKEKSDDKQIRKDEKDEEDENTNSSSSSSSAHTLVQSKSDEADGIKNQTQGNGDDDDTTDNDDEYFEPLGEIQDDNLQSDGIPQDAHTRIKEKVHSIGDVDSNDGDSSESDATFYSIASSLDCLQLNSQDGLDDDMRSQNLTTTLDEHLANFARSVNQPKTNSLPRNLEPFYFSRKSGDDFSTRKDFVFQNRFEYAVDNLKRPFSYSMNLPTSQMFESEFGRSLSNETEMQRTFSETNFDDVDWNRQRRKNIMTQNSYPTTSDSSSSDAQALKQTQLEQMPKDDEFDYATYEVEMSPQKDQQHRKHWIKRIPPPINSFPYFTGFLDVSLSLNGKWRRRYIALYSEEILIFPRSTSQSATAQVKLRGLRIQLEKRLDLTFKLIKRNKVTLYLKADTVEELVDWSEAISEQIEKFFPTPSILFQTMKDQPPDDTESTSTPMSPYFDKEFFPQTENVQHQHQHQETQMNRIPVAFEMSNNSLASSNVVEDESIPEDWRDDGDIHPVRRSTPASDQPEDSLDNIQFENTDQYNKSYAPDALWHEVIEEEEDAAFDASIIDSLNVISPVKSSQEPLPIPFYIPGNGFDDPPTLVQKPVVNFDIRPQSQETASPFKRNDNIETYSTPKKLHVTFNSEVIEVPDDSLSYPEEDFIDSLQPPINQSAPSDLKRDSIEQRSESSESESSNEDYDSIVPNVKGHDEAINQQNADEPDVAVDASIATEQFIDSLIPVESLYSAVKVEPVKTKTQRNRDVYIKIESLDDDKTNWDEYNNQMIQSNFEPQEIKVEKIEDIAESKIDPSIEFQNKGSSLEEKIPIAIEKEDWYVDDKVVASGPKVVDKLEPSDQRTSNLANLDYDGNLSDSPTSESSYTSSGEKSSCDSDTDSTESKSCSDSQESGDNKTAENKVKNIGQVDTQKIQIASPISKHIESLNEDPSIENESSHLPFEITQSNVHNKEEIIKSPVPSVQFQLGATQQIEETELREKEKSNNKLVFASSPEPLINLDSNDFKNELQPKNNYFLSPSDNVELMDHEVISTLISQSNEKTDFPEHSVSPTIQQIHEESIKSKTGSSREEVSPMVPMMRLLPGAESKEIPDYTNVDFDKASNATVESSEIYYDLSSDETTNDKDVDQDLFQLKPKQSESLPNLEKSAKDEHHHRMKSLNSDSHNDDSRGPVYFGMLEEIKQKAHNGRHDKKDQMEVTKDNNANTRNDPFINSKIVRSNQLSVSKQSKEPKPNIKPKNTDHDSFISEKAKNKPGVRNGPSHQTKEVNAIKYEEKPKKTTEPEKNPPLAYIQAESWSNTNRPTSPNSSSIPVKEIAKFFETTFPVRPMSRSHKTSNINSGSSSLSGSSWKSMPNLRESRLHIVPLGELKNDFGLFSNKGSALIPKEEHNVCIQVNINEKRRLFEELALEGSTNHNLRKLSWSISSPIDTSPYNDRLSFQSSQSSNRSISPSADSEQREEIENRRFFQPKSQQPDLSSAGLKEYFLDDYYSEDGSTEGQLHQEVELHVSKLSPILTKWDDEVNGEIYTEKDQEHSRSDDGEDSRNLAGSPLYVIENGKEYRLVPLQERLQAFEPQKVKRRTYAVTQEQLKDKENSLLDNHEDHNKMMTNQSSKIVKVVESQQPLDNINKQSEPSKTILNQVQLERVKCTNLPYIVEEQEVLQNIHIVKNIKNIFLNSNRSAGNLSP